MPIAIHCPMCAKRTIAPDSYAGKPVRCGACGEIFRVPGSTQAIQAERPSPPMRTLTTVESVPFNPRPPEPMMPLNVPASIEGGAGSSEKACPFCGETIKAVAKKCKHCGEILDVVLRAAEEKKRSQQVVIHNTATAVAGAAATVPAAKKKNHGLFFFLVFVSALLGLMVPGLWCLTGLFAFMWLCVALATE